MIRRHDPDEAARMFRRAASLAPNNPDILAFLAFRPAHLPELADEAETWIDRAIRLNPDHPNWYDWHLGVVRFLHGRYAEAADAFARAPDYVDVHAMRTAALALAGDLAGARASLTRLMRAEPAFTIAYFIEATELHPTVSADFARGLRLAGAPEASTLAAK